MYLEPRRKPPPLTRRPAPNPPTPSRRPDGAVGPLDGPLDGGFLLLDGRRASPDGRRAPLDGRRAAPTAVGMLADGRRATSRRPSSLSRRRRAASRRRADDAFLLLDGRRASFFASRRPSRSPDGRRGSLDGRRGPPDGRRALLDGRREVVRRPSASIPTAVGPARRRLDGAVETPRRRRRDFFIGFGFAAVGTLCRSPRPSVPPTSSAPA